MLFDISLIQAMTADIYKGYLKIAILVAIGCHLDVYLEFSKQEKLIIQAFENDIFNETYELKKKRGIVYENTIPLFIT